MRQGWRYFLKLLVLCSQSIQCDKVPLIEVKGFDDIVLSLLLASLNFRLKVVLGQGSTDIRIVLKTMESPRVHRCEALEQLLITVKELIVHLDVEPLLDRIQVSLVILGRPKVLLCELVLLLLFLVTGIDDG